MEYNKQGYTRQKTEDGLYKILNPADKPIRTHIDREMPALSYNCSKHILEEINRINSKNRNFALMDKESNQSLLEPLLSEDLGNELRESFSYCLLSTLYETSNTDFKVDTYALEDDYFLERTDNIQDFPFDLKNKLKIYLEENQEEAFGVIENSIPENVLKDYILFLIQEMEDFERCSLEILYNHFDSFSLALPVLWIKGAIGEQHLVGVYYRAMEGINLEKIMDTPEYEDARFLMNSLLYFKLLHYSYRWQDASLPKG